MLTNTLRYRYIYMLICNVSLINLKNNSPEYLEKLTIVFIKSQGTNRFIVQYFFLIQVINIKSYKKVVINKIFRI